jgi:hypothetical protein
MIVGRYYPWIIRPAGADSVGMSGYSTPAAAEGYAVRSQKRLPKSSVMNVPIDVVPIL